MILAAIDTECTGLNTKEDRIIEVGAALYSTGHERIMRSESFVVDPEGVSIKSDTIGIHGVRPEAADKFGYPQEEAVNTFVEYILQADAVIGHNIIWFDLPIIRETAQRVGLPFPEAPIIIDTMTDIPGVKGEKLITMCADAKDPKTGRDVGFTYEKHCALDDAKAVLRLIRWHEIDGIVARAQSPTHITVSRHNNTPQNNRIAGKAGFRWNGIHKVWWKAVKEIDWDELKGKYQFEIAIRKDLSWEELRD